MKTLKITLFCIVLLGCLAEAQVGGREARIRDVAYVEGVRDNPLVGYGVVVGLNGTGDRSQTVFTTQSLANVLQRMGLEVSPLAIRVNNVAAVFVTANLPPFARPGTKVDVTVSSVGDAKSLEGGILLLTPLRGADGQVYVAAQGALTLGGYSAGSVGNSKQLNHPTVGRIPEGGIVERGLSTDIWDGVHPHISLVLREAEFTSARAVAEAVNREFSKEIARAVDGRRVEIQTADLSESVPQLLATIEGLKVRVERRAKVVVNERTGTVVMGSDVRLGAVSVLHGALLIEVATQFQVSQPPAFSGGETVAVPQTTLKTQDNPARKVELGEGANVEQLITGLQAIGATARDVIAILQAIKSAGALDADLEVI